MKLREKAYQSFTRHLETGACGISAAPPAATQTCGRLGTRFASLPSASIRGDDAAVHPGVEWARSGWRFGGITVDSAEGEQGGVLRSRNAAEPGDGQTLVAALGP